MTISSFDLFLLEHECNHLLVLSSVSFDPRLSPATLFPFSHHTLQLSSVSCFCESVWLIRPWSPATMVVVRFTEDSPVETPVIGNCQISAMLNGAPSFIISLGFINTNSDSNLHRVDSVTGDSKSERVCKLLELWSLIALLCYFLFAIFFFILNFIISEIKIKYVYLSCLSTSGATVF